MKEKLSEQERLFLIDALQKGEPLPLDFKYKIFPTSQKEYELNYAGKMRKQDILRGEDGVLPVPLQIEKVFNGDRKLFDDGWRNLIVFGDNLQFLKTCYQNTDELIKDKVKGKVKLIYIDPPFGTASDFDNNNGQLAYVDKAKNSDFIEFMRRRLIVARELLSDDGSIFLHIDHKKSHYIKIIMDEVFGENNFINEIIWKRKGGSANPKNKLGIVTDYLLWFSKTDRVTVNQLFTLESDEVKKYIEERFNNEDGDGRRYLKSPIVSPNYRENLIYDYKGYKPPKNGWSVSKELMEQWDKENKLYFPKKGTGERIYRKIYIDEYQGQPIQNLWNDIFVINPMATERIDYPTQKPEQLLQRVMQLATNEDDLVMDFFGGSGTTAATAEKMGRRWIVCDIGKLSFYTMQKRILSVEDSKDLNAQNRKYNKKSKSFVTVSVGQYDLGKLFELGKDKYLKFVLNLFEVEQYSKSKFIKGYEICGERNGSYCFVWEFWKYKTDANVDIDFLEELHSNLKNSIGKRFYIIAPANAIDFISDYYEMDDIRYYFLKVPYQIIQELHKQQFKKFRQPQSKNKINDVDDAIGFHFTRQPEVKSEFTEGVLKIKEFRSSYTEEGTDREMDNFESLSMIIIDKDFNGKEFAMSEYHFAADLLAPAKAKRNKQIEEIVSDAYIQSVLKQKRELTIPLNSCGQRVCAKYIDIYGNEFTEEFIPNKPQ